MSGFWNKWIEAMGGRTGLCRWALGLAAATVLWLDPSSGVSTALLAGAGIYALGNGKKTLAAWTNPAGALFGLGAAWAVLFLFLGPQVWGEQYASTRVLLPLTFAFNVRLHSAAGARGDRAWFVAGNAGLAWMALSALV